MKIGVVYNKYIKNQNEAVNILKKALIFNKAEYTILNSEELETGFDFVFAVGGDGTILNVAKFFSQTKTPVMGINLGRLGFLAQSELARFSEIIKYVLKNGYEVEKRIMLESDGHFALNDFVIKGSEKTRTSKFILKINSEAVCEYISDGLIISTPTGSTAYCLSAGGPIINPAVEAFVIVPICPHTLTSRPLVIPDKEILTISSPEGILSVAADGIDLRAGLNSVCIKKSSQKAFLAFLGNNNFYNILTEKLFWGISPCKKL